MIAAFLGGRLTFPAAGIGIDESGNGGIYRGGG